MKRRTTAPTGLPAAVLITAIRSYQRFISPLFSSNCRFHPTCSEYAIEALRVCGLMHGGWMTCTRLARCHPFHPGGADPVPRYGRCKERENGSKDSPGHRLDGQRDVGVPNIPGTDAHPTDGVG